MYINKEEVVRILNAMDKFTDADSFELVNEGQSGIGSTISLIVHTKINGLAGEFKTEISGSEDW